MARPNRRALTILVTAAALFLVGSNVQAGWLFVIGAALVGVVAGGLIGPASTLRGFTVERKAPSHSRVGDSIRVHLALRNESRTSKSLVRVVDDFLGETPLFARQLKPARVTPFEYESIPKRRGAITEASVHLSSGFPFGMGIAKRTIQVETPMLVHPRWVPLVNFPLLETQSSPNEPLHDRRRKGAGMDFYGVREYRPGDSLRHVHWKSSAHGGRLLVKEYEEQLTSRLSIWIDSVEKIGDEPATTFEDAAACAASLVVYALETGHPVQLFCDTSHGTNHLFEPGRPEALDWLSKIEAEGRRGFARLVQDFAHEIQPRSTNVLIFPTTRRNLDEVRGATAILQSFSTRVMAVSLSARTYSSASSVFSEGEESELLSGLHANRVSVYRVPRGGDLAQCLREPFLGG